MERRQLAGVRAGSEKRGNGLERLSLPPQAAVPAGCRRSNAPQAARVPALQDARLWTFGYNFCVRLIVIAFLLLILLSPIYGQTLTGVVVDGKGAAIVGAAVSFRTTGRTDTRTRTDGEGRFTISGTILSSSRLSVRADGFANFDRPLANDGVRDFTIVLQPVGVTGDVTVSITRTETGLVETPASVVVLSRQLLDQTPAQTIDDSLRQIAGFSLFRRSSSKTSNPTTQGANLRGVSGSGAARTTVLFDGLSLNDSFGGWTYWSRVPTIAVEQVEVLRGGASSLYGSGGLSGAISLAPIRRDAPRLFRLQTSAGTQGTLDAGVAAGYSFGRWSFDIAGEGFTTRGYIPVAEAERGAVDTRANGRHHNVLVGIERRFGVRGSANTARVFIRGNLFSENRDNGTALTDNATYFRQGSGGADVERSSLGRFQLRTYYQSQVYDQTFSAVSLDRNTETLTRIQRVPSEASGGNLSWSRALGKHSISSSLELRRVHGFSEEVGLASGTPTSTNRNGGSEDTIAFSVQDIFQLGPHLSLSLGGRFDGWKNYDASLTTRSLLNGATTTVAFPGRQNDAFSPRAAAIYSVNRYLVLYGAYTRSFRAPTLNELYRAFRVGNVVTQANENLRTETADTFEGGARVNTLDGRNLVRVNVFTTAVSDPIVSVTISSTPNLITRQRRNVGETRSTGIEIDGEVSLTRAGISMSYLFVDSRVTEFPASQALVDRRLPQVPRHQFNIRLRYQANDRWYIGVQSRASSGQYEDDLNSLRLRPYVAVDASSTFRLRKGVEVFAAAENIFNNRYDVGLTPNRTVAAPAFVRLGLRFDLSKR
jgi:outer membrane receptor protein involved in Fe transport